MSDSDRVKAADAWWLSHLKASGLVRVVRDDGSVWWVPAVPRKDPA